MEKAAIFCDHLVLQAGKPIRVFGTGEGKADVRFCNMHKTVTAQGGRWEMEFPAQEYGGPYEMTFDLAGEQQTIYDVYVGEVLLCAGQSNMQFLLRDEVTPPENYLDNALVRHYAVTRPEKEENPLCAADGWVCCAKENAGRWSALGYLMGTELQRRTGAAVGVVLCAQGASVIQSWMTRETLQEPLFDIPTEELFADHSYPLYTVWNQFTFLHDTMLTPLLPFSFRAVAWYQGESNASPAESRVYHRLLAAMVQLWREELRDAALPFVCVQIADTRTDEGWLGIQFAQQEAGCRIPGLIMVPSGDICEKEMIHPVTKGALALRMVDAIQKQD